MRLLPVLAALPLATSATNIVMSNDDGWAEINIRTFYNTLKSAGHNLVLSAPAENQSGTGSSDSPATLRTSPCEFNSCPANSPATGANATDPRLNYVNSYPVTSINYGIDTLAPKFFNGGRPELAVTGPNVGSNVWVQVFFSGTVGAAIAAVEAGIPALAFSGASGDPTAWNAASTPLYSTVYAGLAEKLTAAVLKGGAPYLPPDVFLNVNFPKAEAGACDSVDKFKFVLSRINPPIPLITKDWKTCGRTYLPMEVETVGKAGCYVSVVVGDAVDKTTANAAKQRIVGEKLAGLLSCLP